MNTTFKPSVYQQAVFDFVSRGKGSALVNAVAGSGKTTTIVNALGLIPATAKVTFLAFNKKIATELQTRVPSHVRAATFHAQGFAAWRRFAGSVANPDGNKVRNLMSENYGDEDVRYLGGFACRMVSLAKSAGIGAILPDKLDEWVKLADHHDIRPDDEENFDRGLEVARNLLALSTKLADARTSVIDFDDMLYMPLLRNAPFYQVDWLFVDEAQDTNAVQLALLRRMLCPTGRLVAVGDPRQAIYGFRGADATAMGNIRDAFDCIELPLSISYRCAQSVVRFAQAIVPTIEASPTAPEGSVSNVEMSDVTFDPTDVVICRNTAPLVELAYSLIGRGIGCKVLGREIGEALITVIDKMRANSIDNLLERLDKYAQREIARFTSKGQEQKAEGVRDKVDCIVAVIGHLKETRRTIPSLRESISAMFTDDSSKSILTLCTAHKSKGLEWEKVYIYRPDLMPSKWARQQWQKEQEANLQYVAYTRAKRSLVFIE